MKVKLLSTTNPLAKCIIGKECELSYNLKAFFSFNADDLDFDYRKGTWTTSIIKNIKINEPSRFYYEIIITTDNSEYIFGHGTPSDVEPLTDDEKDAISLMLI